MNYIFDDSRRYVYILDEGKKWPVCSYLQCGLTRWMNHRQLIGSVERFRQEAAEAQRIVAQLYL